MDINLAEIVRSVDGRNGLDLLKRDTGRKVREALASYMGDHDGDILFYLDFMDIGSIDYSTADEILGKLMPRVLADEFGRAYVCLKNLSPPQMENIAVALEKRNLAMVVTPWGGGWTWLGKLNPYLQKTLDLVYDHRLISAREMSDLLQLALNTVSTRLINLHKQRLVGRRESHTEKGMREFVYFSLIRGFGLA